MDSKTESDHCGTYFVVRTGWPGQVYLLSLHPPFFFSTLSPPICIYIFLHIPFTSSCLSHQPAPSFPNFLHRCNKLSTCESRLKLHNCLTSQLQPKQRQKQLKEKRKLRYLWSTMSVVWMWTTLSCKRGWLKQIKRTFYSAFYIAYIFVNKYILRRWQKFSSFLSFFLHCFALLYS